MWAALGSGMLPGQFDPTGTTYAFPVVVSETARGSKIYWRIQVHLAGPPAPGPAPAAASAGDSGTKSGQPTLYSFNSEECLKPGKRLPPGYRGLIISNSWHEGGELRRGGVPTSVLAGKNLGKKNETNVITQALRDALGLYNKHLKGGGRPDFGTKSPAPASAAASPVSERNQPRPLPMLVKKLGATVDATLTPEAIAQGVTLQRKLNGVRMVAYAAGPRETVFYSRTAGVYQGMSSLRQQVTELLSFAPAAWTMHCANLKTNPCGDEPPTVYLDGELYKHGKGLNWISGESRSATGGDELEYWIFDCFFPLVDPADGKKSAGPVLTSRFRQQYLDLLFLLWSEGRAGGDTVARVVRVENVEVPVDPGDPGARDAIGTGSDFIFAKAREFVAEGFEGAIARRDNRPYRLGTKGYHSSNLVKIKPLHDAEYTVVGYTEGTRGKDVGAVIWICEVPPSTSEDGKPLPGGRFSVVPKNMTYAVRYKVHSCLGKMVESDEPAAPPAARATLTRFDRDFRGRPLTVEFPELSAKTGIPTQAKALAFRTYEPGAGFESRDPLERLLAEC